MEGFLAAFTACQFKRPVKLIVQGSTQTPEEAAEFDRIIKEYDGTPHIEFWHRPIIGIEWQKGIMSVDTLVMPYGNDRYLYHTSALISNAMGLKKIIIAADNVNPEVLAAYDIGVSFHNGDFEDLTRTMEKFVNGYENKKIHYLSELNRSYVDFAPSKLAKNIVAHARP